jgi:hypothetical protein
VLTVSVKASSKIYCRSLRLKPDRSPTTMLRYGRGVFRVGRGARGVALVGVSSCALLGLTAPAGAAVGYSGDTVVPGDGRLTTPDYHAMVTAVAWPVRNGTQEPTTGRRFVRFTLEVSAPNQSASPTSPAPSLGAALRWNGTSHALSLTSIDDELQAGAGGSSDSASASYLASVPNDTHDVDLVLSEATFSQSFDLWTLRRVPPSPAVLYRDPTQTAITGTSAVPATLSLSNPTDGFTSSADVTLQSATLGFFAPPGTTLSPNPDQAVLSVALDGEFPTDPSDPTGSGHYLGSTAPLPASMLSFSLRGGTSAPATISGVGDTTGKGNSDDGLFDATYSFLVPATLTSGTLEVAAGSFTGAEFTLYTAERGTSTIDISQPATLALTFRAPVAAAIQRTPPWVGQPDPPTSAASTSPGATSGSGGPYHAAGFPLWVAIVVLVVFAFLAVLFERWRRSTRLATASTASPLIAVSDPAPPSASVPLVVTEPENVEVPGPETTSWSDRVDDPEAADDVRPAAAAVVATDLTRAGATSEGSAALHVLGPSEVLGLEIDSDWALLMELFRYLVFHDHRHLKAAQIAIGLCPGGSRDLDEKTVRNALTRLRRCIGPKHLPQATSAGYLIEGIGSDCVTFQRLSRQADTAGGEEAISLRKEALALVRGAPFEDVNDEWIDAERIRSNLVVSIVTCATRLATDLLEAERPAEAEEAASAGLRGAPRHYVLWEIGAWAIGDQSDRGLLELWMTDANANLDEEDYARLERSAADHLGPSAS